MLRENGGQTAQWLLRQLQSRSIIALLAVAGLLITATVSGWLYHLEHQSASRAFERSVEVRAQALQRELLSGVEGLYTLREVVRYVDSLPVLVFEDVAAAVLARNPDILSLEWIPKVPLSARVAHERSQQRYLEGYRIRDFSLPDREVAAAERQAYFPVSYVYPRFTNLRAVGVDMASDPRRLEALQRAARSGNLVATEPVELALRTRRGTGVVMVVPVYFGRPDTREGRETALTGYVAAVVEARALASRIAPQKRLYTFLTIEDITDPQRPLQLATVGKHGDHPLYSVPVPDVAGRSWRLTMSPSSQYLQAQLSVLPWASALVGTLMVVIVCGYLLLLQRRGELVAELVDERTAELREANQRLAQMSVTDPLTRLSNRRAFDDYLAQEWQRAMRDKQPLTLMLLDVDFFKRINDQYGHEAGDRVLRELARELAATFRRPADLVARYGGEEFAVIMPHTGPEVVDKVEMFRRHIAGLSLPLGDGGEVSVTVSAGLGTVTPATGIEPRVLVKRTDEALYAAKRGGRNRVNMADLSTPLAESG
ncbi:MAG: diguanylate cyclase [Alcanivoracaceae bacterium]|nr:diguanylate cyclase [Alcanivoracaceae bacterium]